MIPSIKAYVPEELIATIIEMEKVLKRKIPEEALSLAVKPIKAKLEVRVPDGWQSNDGDPPSRALQTEAVRNRFPLHMKDHVGIKTISDDGGTLKLVGVETKVGQVNFDFGDKAMRREGRHHVFWGKEAALPPTPRYRRNLEDIAAEVRNETAEQVGRLVTQYVKQKIEDLWEDL
jgi:hypothetical protein